MYRVSVLVLLGLVALINAEDDCATQHKNAFVCMTEIKESDDIKAVLDKKKQVMKDTCAPDYPKSCITEWDNMMSCCKELTAKGKDDPDFKSLEKKITEDINKCFETEPQNPFKELEEFFMPIYLKKALKKKLKEELKGVMANASMEEGEDSFEIDLPPPPPEMPFRLECIPTPSMMKCCKKEMTKAYTSDAAFKKAIISILEKKDKCDAMVKRECFLSTPELNKCFWGAHKDFFKTVFDKMSTCMKGKGSGGSGGESNKGGEKEKEAGTEAPKGAKSGAKSAPKSAKKGDK